MNLLGNNQIPYTNYKAITLNSNDMVRIYLKEIIKK